MWKQLAIIVTAGAASGLVFVAPISSSSIGLYVVNYFVQLPLLLVGLSLGTLSAVTACVAAIVPVAATMGLVGGLLYVFAFVIPAMVVVNRALLSRVGHDGGTEWFPPGNLLMILTAYGALAFVATMILLSGQEGGLWAVAHEAMYHMLSTFLPAATDADLNAAAARLSGWVPAMVVMSWLLMNVVNSVIAQGILVASAKNLRPTPRYAALTLPRFLAALLAAALALWLIGDGDIALAGRTLAAVFATPYFLLGLTVVHRLTSGWPGRGFVLTAFYVMLLLLDWPSFAAVAILGFVEQWLGIRQRFAGSAPDSEDD